MSEKAKAPEQQIPIGLRLILIASLGLLLLATLAELQEAPTSPTELPPVTESSTLDHLIIPGTRVGPLTLGLPVGQANEILGQAQLRPRENGIVHLYEEYGLVVFSEEDRVVSVTVRSPAFKTRAGVGVESDVDEVLSTLGRDYEMAGSPPEYVLHNFGEGWHVGVKNHKVTYFQITPKLNE